VTLESPALSQDNDMRHIALTIALISSTIAATNLSGATVMLDDLPVLQPLLNGQTVGLIGLDLTKLDLPTLQKQFIDPLCQTDADRLAAAITVSKLREWTQLFRKDGIERVFLITTIEYLPAYWPKQETEHGILKHLARSSFLVVPRANEKLRQELRKALEGMRMTVYVGYNRVTFGPKLRETKQAAVIAFDEVLEHFDSLKPEPRPEFEQALAAAGNQPICIAAVPPTIFARAAEEILLEPLPGTDEPLGPILARGVRWVSVGLEPNLSKFSSQVIIQSADVNAARNLEGFLGQATTILGPKIATDDFPLDIANALATLLPKAQGDKLLLSLDGKRGTDFQVFAQKAFAAVMADNYRRQSMNNLNTIAIAMHNHHDLNKHLPERAICNKNGKPLLSWRVAILPWLEANSLYKEFHLDEPWDSEHNRKLIERMPPSYLNPDTGYLHSGRTRYLAPVGENLAFPPNNAISFKDFTDGTVRTILVVEADADHAVIWTKPDDIEVDLENPTRGLTNGKTTFNTAFTDGSTHVIPGSIKPETLRAMFTRNGGEFYKF
jgi:hypothetical protein